MSASSGAGTIKRDFGASGGSTGAGIGFGTPGVGATYGFGPYKLRGIGDSFRPRADEFGHPFPGDATTAAPQGRNSEYKGAAEAAPSSLDSLTNSPSPAPPPIPAFQPDAVYSPMGDFFGNFTRRSGAAAATSPAAFNASRSGIAPMEADPNAFARRTYSPSLGSALDTGAPVADSPVQRNDHGPLSLNDVYLLYLKQLNARQIQPAPTGGVPGLTDGNAAQYPGRASGNGSQASVFDTDAAPAPYLLSRRDGNNLPAIASDAAAPAALFALPDSRRLNGDIVDFLASLAGVNPRNPTQWAASPQDEQLRGFYRDDPTQPWFVQGRR